MLRPLQLEGLRKVAHAIFDRTEHEEDERAYPRHVDLLAGKVIANRLGAGCYSAAYTVSGLKGYVLKVCTGADAGLDFLQAACEEQRYRSWWRENRWFLPDVLHVEPMGDGYFCVMEEVRAARRCLLTEENVLSGLRKVLSHEEYMEATTKAAEGRSLDSLGCGYPRFAQLECQMWLQSREIDYCWDGHNGNWGMSLDGRAVVFDPISGEYQGSGMTVSRITR